MTVINDRLSYIREFAKDLEKKKKNQNKQAINQVEQTLRNLELLNEHITKQNFLLKDLTR